MKKVLHAVYRLSAGGVESMVVNILKNIDKEKFQCDLLLNVYSEDHFYAKEVKSLGANIFVIDTNDFDEFVKQWHKVLFENKYDIVHGHLPDTAFIYLQLAKKLGIKRVLHSHTSLCIEKDLEEFYASAQEHAEVKLACSKSAGEMLFPESDFMIINNGIKTQEFEFSEKVREEIREEFGIKDEIVIGHIGRFVGVKNHTFQLDIFAEILKKEKNAKLLLVGEGELFEHIKEKAENLGILENIIFAGVRKDVNKILMAIDLFLFPSIYEGLGIALVEAQASGLPSIASTEVPKEAKLCDLVEFISLEETAEFWAEKALETISKFKNPKNQENQENKEISQNSENREKYAQIVKDNGYDIVDTVKKLEEIYDSL